MTGAGSRQGGDPGERSPALRFYLPAFNQRSPARHGHVLEVVSILADFTVSHHAVRSFINWESTRLHFGIVITVNMELPWRPPVGLNLYVIPGGPSVPLQTIKGTFPFTCLGLIQLAIIT